MEDGYRLIDYGININDVVQLMIRATPIQAVSPKADEEAADNNEEKEKKDLKKTGDESLVDISCEYYEVSFWETCKYKMKITNLLC